MTGVAARSWCTLEVTPARTMLLREPRLLPPKVSNALIAVSAIDRAAVSVIASCVRPNRETVSASSISSALGNKTGQLARVSRMMKWGSCTTADAGAVVFDVKAETAECGLCVLSGRGEDAATEGTGLLVLPAKDATDLLIPPRSDDNDVLSG